MTLEEMKRIKQERGYSLAQLSEYSGVPLGTLQKIFSGETEHPRYATRRALEQALTMDRKDYPDGPAHDKPQTVEEAISYTVDNLHRQDKYTLEDYYTLPDDRRV